MKGLGYLDHVPFQIKLTPYFFHFALPGDPNLNIVEVLEHSCDFEFQAKSLCKVIVV